MINYRPNASPLQLTEPDAGKIFFGDIAQNWVKHSDLIGTDLSDQLSPECFTPTIN